MKHYPNSAQLDQVEIDRFINEMKMANLITFDPTSNQVESGVFNPVYLDGKFYLHLNRSDDQFKKLKETKKANLIYFDFLCNIPSYWIDENDGGVATSYYRHIDYTCDANIFEDKETLASILPKFLTVFQSEGGYTPINIQEEIYQSDFKVLGIVELVPKSFKCKFKLGQNRPIEKRLEICDKLIKRNQDKDLIAAKEVKNWIERYSK